MVEQRYHIQHNTPKQCGPMTAAIPPDWNVFKQIFADHWDGFTRVYSRYATSYYAGLVTRCLGAGIPQRWGISNIGVYAVAKGSITSP